MPGFQLYRSEGVNTVAAFVSSRLVLAAEKCFCFGAILQAPSARGYDRGVLGGRGGLATVLRFRPTAAWPRKRFFPRKRENIGGIRYPQQTFHPFRFFLKYLIVAVRVLSNTSQIVRNIQYDGEKFGSKAWKRIQRDTVDVYGIHITAVFETESKTENEKNIEREQIERKKERKKIRKK